MRVFYFTTNLYICNMSTIVTPYLTKLDSIELELPNIARQAVIDNSSEIVLLIKSQLSSGFNT